MKRYLFVILTFLFFVNHLFSQTEKGRLMYGGPVSCNIKSNSMTNYSLWGLSISVAPQFGGFVYKNFALMGVLSLDYSSYSLFYMMGPEFRYYAGGEKVKFFAFANVMAGGIYTKFAGPGISSNRFDFTASIGPGVAIFAGPNFSLHSHLFLKYEKYYGSFSTGLGISFYGLLSPKNKKEAAN